METHKNTPEKPSSNAPQTEIDTLLKAMVEKEVISQGLGENKELNQQTPLDNLKGILSQADARARVSASSQEVPIKENKSAIFLESDAVARLSELIRQHRAKKGSSNP